MQDTVLRRNLHLRTKQVFKSEGAQGLCNIFYCYSIFFYIYFLINFLDLLVFYQFTTLIPFFVFHCLQFILVMFHRGTKTSSLWVDFPLFSAFGQASNIFFSMFCWLQRFQFRLNIISVLCSEYFVRVFFPFVYFFPCLLNLELFAGFRLLK